MQEYDPGTLWKSIAQNKTPLQHHEPVTPRAKGLKSLLGGERKRTYIEVTKMGATRQCAQCTLNYFRPGLRHAVLSVLGRLFNEFCGFCLSFVWSFGACVGTAFQDFLLRCPLREIEYVQAQVLLLSVFKGKGG